VSVTIADAPLFDPKVGLSLAMEFLKHDGKVEVSCACGWDHDRHKITSGRVIFRGNASRTTCVSTDFEPGELLLHNHPTGVLWPSEQDLAAAEFLAMRGIGLAICNNFCTELYVVREPALPKPKTPEPRRWSVSLGRYQLTFTRSAA
jgi:ATP-dependent DNA helicase DinG